MKKHERLAKKIVKSYDNGSVSRAVFEYREAVKKGDCDIMELINILHGILGDRRYIAFTKYLLNNFSYFHRVDCERSHIAECSALIAKEG